MATLLRISDAFTSPLIELGNRFYKLIPELIAAVLILIVGYAVSYIVGHAFTLILEKLGLDRQISRSMFSKSLGGIHVSRIIGEVTKWYIFVIFLQSAVTLVNLGALSLVLTKFVVWLPKLITAILVLVGGLVLAHYMELKIEHHFKKVRYGQSLGKGLGTLTIFIVAIIGIKIIGIDVSVLENGFLILLAGVALALGLAFGLGAKQEAANFIKKIRRLF